ncbi:MAG TPA: CIA30 family protein [Arenimonas sp.]|nr:CIA30 family protein [Arenimonas sp.]
MKISSSWQLAMACSLLLAAAGSAVWLNPATQNAKTNISAKEEIKQAENSFAVTNVRVFDGEKTIGKTSVLIQDGKIASIGENIKIPDNTPVYDGAGKTLLPGLIDSHTHTYGDARKDALRFGVTTEMDMFTDWHQLAAAKKQRESYARTDLADLWSAGTLATVPGGHGTEYGMKIPTLTKPEEAPAFVQARIDEGSDYIKIVFDDGSAYGPTVKIKSLTPDVTQALINSAHEHDKKAVIHIAAYTQAKTMLDQGADGLVHSFIDRVADAEFIEQAKKQHTFIVPTLSVTGSLAGADEGKKLAHDAALQEYLTLSQSTALKASFPPQWQNPKVLDNALASVKLFHDAGIPLLAGTDAGNPSTAHGVSLHGELALLVKGGLSPAEALNSATALPAKIFGLNDRGRIAVGMRADLILVNGDPTKNIAETRDIEFIWKNGYRLERNKTGTPAAEAAAFPTDALVSDFEQEAIASRYGKGWALTTDKQMGGESEASIKLIEGGANQSKGAMEISGQIRTGFAYPWAGAFFAPGAKAMQAVNYSKAKELVFWVKGDGRKYSVMTFSTTQGGIPPSQNFTTGPEWQQVRLPLSGFTGLELSQVTGFSFNASAPEGNFRFVIDDVEIK